MRYTDDFRMWVILEVYRENASCWDLRVLTDSCRIVAKDLALSRSVVSLWVNNYIRQQKRCITETAIKLIVKEN